MNFIKRFKKSVIFCILFIGMVVCSLATVSHFLYKENINKTNNIELQEKIIGKPIFDSELFNITNITNNSATLKLIVQNDFTSEDAENGVFDFDPENDVVLLWDKNKDGKFNLSESYETNGGWNKGVFQYIGEEHYDSSLNKFNSYEYKINDLKSNKEYSNFGIYIKSNSSDWKINDWSNFPNDIIINDDKYLFFISDDVLFYTLKTDVLKIIILSIVIFVILVILFILILLKSRTFINRHISLSLYFDGEKSYAEKELILNLVNASRFPHIWNSNENDLILISAGRNLDAIFQKTPDVHGGYRIYITEDTGSKRSLMSIMAASRFNEFHIGVKGHQETHHAKILSDKQTKNITKIISKSENIVNKEARNEIIKKFTKKHSIKDAKINSKSKKPISHISDTKSTMNSLRYQIIFPDNHILISKNQRDKWPEEILFYHVYNGKLYEIENKFMGRYGHLYEFDLIDLQPASIYVGLSASIDGGKTICPSAALFGITRDEFEVIHSKTHSHLGKPKNSKVPKRNLWDKKEAEKYLEKSSLKRMYDVIVKKHFENDHPESFLLSENAGIYYEDYISKWLIDEPKNKKGKFVKKENVQFENMSTSEKFAGYAFEDKFI